MSAAPIRVQPLRPGMTLVELLVAMLVGILLLQAMVGFFIGQSRLVGEQESMRTARDAVRSAMHVFMADLRRVESSAGVEAAAPTSVTLRVPFALGIICSSTSTAAVISMMPVDSMLYSNAGFSGYAWRSGDGDYSYVVNPTSFTSTDTSVCAAASISTLAGGYVSVVTPGAGTAVAVGTPVLLYQRVRYEFRAGADGSRLVRTELASGVDEVLVELFDAADTRFRFHVAGSANAQDAPPADLDDISGLEIVMEGVGDRPRPDGGSVATVQLATSVFFKN